MKFRPLQINYQHEALHYEEEQLRSHFFHVPYSGETNSFHVDVNATTDTQRNALPSFVTNVSRRPLHDKTIYEISSEFSCSNILKTKGGINFVVREDMPYEQFCFNKENNRRHKCDFIQDKNVALLTLPHSHQSKTNEKLNKIIAPDSVSALIAHQQGQRKRNKRRTPTEFSCLVGMSQCRPLLPDTFIGCIISDKDTTASDTNKNDNHWLKKRKDIWDLQRELIKSKRLARRQMPWWYYYNYQRNKPTHTELLPSNLTVVQLDMKLPSLDHAHVTVSTVDSTTAIRKPFLPWIIKSTVPSTRATKQHQKREHPTSILPLVGKPLKGLENFIFHQSIPLGEEISSCLYDSCTTSAGRTYCIKKIMEDVALPPSKEVDSTEKNILDVNVSLSIPSAVAAVLLIIPHKRMWEPNNRHSMQNHGTNVLASKRFSEIMGCMLTSDSSSNSVHAFMILPHRHQLQGINTTNLQKSDFDNNSTPSLVSMKNSCTKPSESGGIDDNQTLPQRFFEKDCSTNETVMFGKDLHVSGLTKDCKRKRELITCVQLQLMTGCFIQQNHVPGEFYGFLTGDTIDESIYHFRYRNIFLRQHEEHSHNNYMVHFAFRLQALHCVNLSLLLPPTSPRQSTTIRKKFFPPDMWLPKYLLKNRRNPESKVKKLPSSLTFDPAVTIPDKTVNMTTDSLLTRLPREFHQIIKTHSTADLSLNAYENWINGTMLELSFSTHDTVALRSELTHLMTKANELVLGRKSVSSIFCVGRTYDHHNMKAIDMEEMGLPLPFADQRHSVHKTRSNDTLRNNKRKPRQELEDCDILQDGKSEKKESNKVAEKKRRKKSIDRENFAQDFGYNDVRVTTAHSFEGVALTDDNVRKTARLNIDKTKPTITQPYEEFQNRTTDGFCSDIAEDCNRFFSKDDLTPFIASKATPMADPSKMDLAAPPVRNLEEIPNSMDCNGDASGLATSVQTLNRNVSRSMMDDFFSLMGRSRREKENKCDVYDRGIHSFKDSTLDKLTYQQPISIIKRASNKSKCEAIPLSENSSATHASTFHQQRTPITVLCSGHFLENFSETVANLGSGQWSRNNNESVVSGSCIIMCDSPVVDFVGVDIELPDSSGIICVRLSQLANSQNNCVKNFTKRVLYLASIGRYLKLLVYVVCDVDITRSLSMDLFMLQNTLVMKQNCYCPCEKMAVYLTSLPALSSCIALLLLEHPSINSSCDKNNPEVFLGKLGSTREKIQERAIFLVSLIPSLTALDALNIIHSISLENYDTNANSSPLRVEHAFTNFLLDATAVEGEDDAVSRVKLIGASKMFEKSLLRLSKAMKCNLVHENNFQAGN